MWIHLRKECIDRARRRNAIARSLMLSVDDSILDRLEIA